MRTLTPLLLVLALLGPACSTSAPPAAPATPAVPAVPAIPPATQVAAPGAPGATAALEAEIAAAIGPARCQSDAQCRTLPLGARACGGPASYRAYALPGSDEAQLKRLAERHADLARSSNEQSGRISHCALLVDPGARCVAQRCQLNAPGAAAGAVAR